ncbi:hypothetical protein ACFPRL_34860 [Pseudoclavibacter helvolus]
MFVPLCTSSCCAPSRRGRVLSCAHNAAFYAIGGLDPPAAPRRAARPCRGCLCKPLIRCLTNAR